MDIANVLRNLSDHSACVVTVRYYCFTLGCCFLSFSVFASSECLSATEQSAPAGSNIPITKGFDDAEAEDRNELVWFIETEVIERENYESASNNNYRETTIEFGAQWFGALNRSTDGFVDLSVLHEEVRLPSGDIISDEFVELNNVWIETRLDGLNSALRFGLQEFEEERGWWWNDDLVGVRWHGTTDSDWDYSVALLAETGDYNSRTEPADPEQDDLYYLLLQGQGQVSANTAIALYGLHSVDRSGAPGVGTLVASEAEDEIDATLTHLGIGIDHTFDNVRIGQLTLRGDIAFLNGTERRLEFADDETDDDSADEEGDAGSEGDENALDSNEDESLITGEVRSDINAWGIDIGAEWRLPFNPYPMLEFGLAIGSGSRTPQRNTTFRQTNLHDNSRDRGIYGNVLVPELSNLSVLSLAVTVPAGELGNFSLYHHRFEKVRTGGEMAENELDLEIVDTDSSDIGNETGLYFQFEPFDDAEVTIALSQFRLGRLFGSGSIDSVDRVALEFTFEF